MRDDCGHYSHTIAKREHIVDRLSPTARHANFPKLYAKPVPMPSNAEKAVAEIKALTRRNTALVDEVFRLKARIRALERTTPPEPLSGPPAGTVAALMAIAADIAGSTVEAMQGPTRAPSRALPRQFAMWVVKRVRWDLTNAQIGHHFGGRDPSTVLHALERVDLLCGALPFAGWIADPRTQELLPPEETVMDGTDYPATKKYRPSNGTAGMIFEDRFCDRCKRDAKYRRTQDGKDGCRILLYVGMYEVHEPQYPVEWVVNLHDPVGLTARCTAFQFDDPDRRSRPRKPRPAPLLELMNA